MVSPADRHTLLLLARQTLTTYLQKGSIPNLQTDNPGLLEPRATFVTLRVRATGELRGCRGETQAHHSLMESVARMIIASATDDPRFPAVKANEIPNLHIEINALTPLAPILPQEIEIGRHGLLIVNGSHVGLFLPEVAIRYRWDVETFLQAVGRKAGLQENSWKVPETKLFGFEAEAWEEE